MRKEVFANRLHDLLPAPDEATTQQWLNLAEECTQFYQEHRCYMDALLRQTPESVLEEFYAGLILASQRYGQDAAQKVYELVRTHGLYANELIGAAAFFYGGGTPEAAPQFSIDEMFESGELMGPRLPQTDREKKSLAAQIARGLQPLWEKYPVIQNSPVDFNTLFTLYEIREAGAPHTFLSAAGLWPESLLSMTADAVRTQGLSFAESLDNLDRQGNFIPGLPAQLRLAERLPAETAEWLTEGFGSTTQIAQRVVLDFDSKTISMEFNSEVFPHSGQWALMEQSISMPDAVFHLASSELYPAAPHQDTAHLHALYTILDNGKTSYLGSAASCAMPFRAMWAAGAVYRPDESAAETLVRLTPSAMPFYEPDVNAGPVFYPVQPDRAARFLREFGTTDETAALVRLDTASRMLQLEYNARCYPEGAPCDFTIPIDEGLCCLQEIIDELPDGEECAQGKLDALMRDKIEESLRQMEPDGMAPEVRS